MGLLEYDGMSKRGGRGGSMSEKPTDERYSDEEAARRYRATLTNVLAAAPDHKTKPGASPKKRGRPPKAKGSD
jgi:hypothetical protein